MKMLRLQDLHSERGGCKLSSVRYKTAEQCSSEFSETVESLKEQGGKRFSLIQEFKWLGCLLCIIELKDYQSLAANL